MNQLDSITYLVAQVLDYPYLIILSTILITYAYAIFRGGFVSDDLQGIEQYDGTLMYPRDDGKLDDKGHVIKERKICYGTLSKWVRYHLCGGHFPSRHRYKKPDGKDGDFIESGKIPSHHHTLSVVLFSIASILLYHTLLHVTTPLIALMTVCLFVVHPVCLQAVAWPSAIGYILSLICITASINIAMWTTQYVDINHVLIGLTGLIFFQVWGVYAQGIPMLTWIILLILGQPQMAIVALLASGAVASMNLLGYVNFRKAEFKKQQMAQSTSFTIRKPIVALKTIAYYFYLCLFPSKMGLYHEWGFHYDKRMELWDWRAITGLILVSISAYFFFTTDILAIKFGILWFYAFLFLFLNWITAQQWVTERYVFIPVIGLSLVACVLLQHFIPIYFLIFGLFMARTLCHIPTYDNELRFYLSNTWNFPKSEVAYGNLGVAYTGLGLGGASADMWRISASINPEYDVPHYNLFSKIRSESFAMIQSGDVENGLRNLANAIPVIDKVLTCKVLHFPEMWKKEAEEIKAMVANPTNYLVGEMFRLLNLSEFLNMELAKSQDEKRRSEVIPSIKDNEVHLTNLESYLKLRGIQFEMNPEKAILNKLTQRR